MERDPRLSEGVDELAAVKVNGAYDGEIDRVGLRPGVGPGTPGSMASDRVGPKLPFRPVVRALQIRVRDERHQLRQVPHDPTLEPCDVRVLREVDAVLAVPDRATPLGRRNYALLLFLYNTGARATEAAELPVGALALDAVPAVRILGKGRKLRHCPLWPHTAAVLRALLASRPPGPPDARVFVNIREQPLTRFGVHALVERTVAVAAKTTPSLASKRVGPHTFRHTTAVHLLRAGVDINTIRAWLGHVSLETTNRYAEVDLEMKAKALATCALPESATPRDPATADWKQDRELMAFLKAL